VLCSWKGRKKLTILRKRSSSSGDNDGEDDEKSRKALSELHFVELRVEEGSKKGF